ncbi:hypothetical protein BHM03_00012999 [Ensete ventricosum]|nr:hypothetical protein BHM03_00012999 [Ensete ventricosum]
MSDLWASSLEEHPIVKKAIEEHPVGKKVVEERLERQGQSASLSGEAFVTLPSIRRRTSYGPQHRSQSRALGSDARGKKPSP